MLGLNIANKLPLGREPHNSDQLQAYHISLLIPSFQTQFTIGQAPKPGYQKISCFPYVTHFMQSSGISSIKTMNEGGKQMKDNNPESDLFHRIITE